jgi:hypothetical protein
LLSFHKKKKKSLDPYQETIATKIDLTRTTIIPSAIRKKKMRIKPFSDLAAIGAALLVLVPSVDALGFHSHASVARRHMHGHSLIKRGELLKRSKCEFPTDAGLVPVTPNEKNAGWAMSPDQACTLGVLVKTWD